MGLTVKQIERLSERGRYREGSVKGLFLQVTDKGVRSWLLRYERFGRRRWMGLGPIAIVDLAEARRRAIDARRQLLDGVDPLEARKATRSVAALEAAKRLTFKEAAERYDAHNNARWKNRKAAAQFLSTLADYAFPKIGALSVGDVDTGQVLRVLEQHHSKYPNQRLWEAIPETAGRLRGRIENVLDWATTRGYRTGENPARWRGHLSNVLLPRGQVSKPKNFEALPFADVAAFIADLRQREAVAARALEFTIMTAARTNEAVAAKWAEIDLGAKTWTIPAARMKAKREHRVPLSAPAMEILESLPRERGNEYVFIGPAKGKGLSGMSMLMLLRRMGRTGLTVHGFRSSFRDWAAERTNYPNHVVEMALAHTVKGVEAAYRRGDLFDKRRRLMAEWAKYAATPAKGAARAESGNVVAIRAVAS